jgi:hypothetical protein
MFKINSKSPLGVHLCIFGFIFWINAIFLAFVPSSLAQGHLRPGYVVPKQHGFELGRAGDNFKYTYRWTDSYGRPTTSVFLLHSNDVEKGNTEFRRIDASADAKIVKELQKRADELGKKFNAQVKVTDNDGLYSLKVEGRGLTQRSFEHLYAEVQRSQKEVIDDYLTSAYYSVENKGDRYLIRPDYKTLVKRYEPVGRIVGKTLFKSSPGDVRGFVEHSLEFIQAIPYGRDMNDGADFQTPIGLFTDNMGDCDTKAVALGSILKNYGIGFVFLITSDHLFMGIEVSKRQTDRTFKYGGKSYVLAEPAGEGFPLGTAYPDSLDAFKDGKLQVVSF